MMVNADHGKFAARFRSVSKTFGDTVALSEVSLALPISTIHAFVGQNGAGKSTALGVIAGKHSPDTGTVEVFGHELTGKGPREALNAGVSAIYQELSIVPSMTAVDNAFLGHELLTSYGRPNNTAMRERFGEACEMLGINISPRVLARDLSVAQSQTLEIVRGIVSGSQLILFDEPTTSLSDEDRKHFFKVVALLGSRGISQLLVSHNLGEVLEHADAITTFRDGCIVDTRPSGDWSRQELIRAMAGPGNEGASEEAMSKRTTMSKRTSAGDKGSSGKPPALRASGVRVRPGAQPADLCVGPGEIVGIAGLMGSGRSSLLRTLAGAMPGSSGSLEVNGTRVSWPRSVTRASKAGVALLAEDRKKEGVLLQAEAQATLLLGGYGRLSTRGFLRRSVCRRAAVDAAERCQFDPDRLGSIAGNLSGGNQQKLLIGRWINAAPAVLLCDEPSRGVDVIARREIWRALHEMSAESRGLLVVSSEFEELLDNCHRVLVLVGGRIVAEYGDPAAIDLGQILQAIFDNSSSVGVA
jgi:ABC-type sugar transport system ATPase subunit